MKYLYTGDYEEYHKKTKLIPGQQVELTGVPARLAQWLVPVAEEKVEAVKPKAAKKAPKKKKQL